LQSIVTLSPAKVLHQIIIIFQMVQDMHVTRSS
jgi:hypothetical protein